MKHIPFLLVGLCFGQQAFSQTTKSDSTRHLNEVEVIGARERIQIERLPDVHGDVALWPFSLLVGSTN